MTEKEIRIRHEEKYEVSRSLEKYKGREGVDYVKCEICSKRGLYIDARHLKTRHNITKELYTIIFPYCKIISDKKRKAQSRPNNKGNSGRRFSGEHRTKLALSKLGDKNPAWKDGCSDNSYCGIWRDLEYKQSILERDDYRCQNPDCWGKGFDLNVHHIDYDKMNCHPDNLITLCRSCNSRANSNRDYWKKIYNHTSD